MKQLWEIHFTIKSSHVCRFNCCKEIFDDYFFYAAREEKICKQLNFLKRTENFCYFRSYLQGILDFNCGHCNVPVTIDVLSIDDLIVSIDLGLEGMKMFLDELSPQILIKVINKALLPLQRSIFTWLLCWRRYFPALGKDVALLIAKITWETRYEN